MSTLTAPDTLATLSRQSTAASLWAARRIAAYLSEQPADLLSQTVPSSFNSLADTLWHIQMVEDMWLHTLQGQSLAIPYGQRYAGSIPDLLAAFVDTAEKLDQYVQSLSEEDLQELCAFKVPVRWPEFDDFERARFQIIQHAVMHAAYHRGQIVTIGHALELSKAPITDFITYLILPS